MNSGISYKGKVTVKTMYKGKVLKERVYLNKGCIPLFKYIAYCLSGNAENNSKGIPLYLRLWNVNDGDIEPFSPGSHTSNYTENTYNPVPWTDSDVVINESTPSASVTYTFLVSGSNVVTGSTTNVFAIYDADHMVQKLVPSAWFEVEDEDGLQGTVNAAGVSYVVMWEMTVSNQNTVSR